jgi:hypothetical protein
LSIPVYLVEDFNVKSGERIHGWVSARSFRRSHWDAVARSERHPFSELM